MPLQLPKWLRRGQERIVGFGTFIRPGPKAEDWHPQPEKQYELFGVSRPEDIPHQCVGCSKSYAGLLQPQCAYCGAGRSGYYREVRSGAPEQAVNPISSEQIALGSFFFPNFGDRDVDVGDNSQRDRIGGHVIKIGSGINVLNYAQINIVGATDSINTGNYVSMGVAVSPSVNLSSHNKVNNLATANLLLGGGTKINYAVLTPGAKMWAGSWTHIKTLVVGPTHQRLYLHDYSTIEFVLVTPRAGEIGCGSNVRVIKELGISFEEYYRHFVAMSDAAKNALYR